MNNIHIEQKPPTPYFSSDHLLDEDGKCWCEPEKWEDPENGNIVWIHRKIREEGH
jgi:hypothetical protein